MVSLGRGKTPHAVEPSCRDRHSERSEESRCMELVTAMMINTCQQEGGRGEASGQHRGVRFLHSGRNDRGAVLHGCHWGGERRHTLWSLPAGAVILNEVKNLGAWSW